MFLQRFDELKTIVENCEYSDKQRVIQENKALRLFHSFLLRVKNDKGIVYVIGNGGSAGIASHFSVDLLNALKIPSNTLYDTNIMTCFSNDYGYEQSFQGPLEVLLTKNDLLVAISSSGKSANILNAVHTAKQTHCNVITLSGFSSSNPLKNLGDLNFWLDVCDYGLVETGHFFLLHTIIDAWKSNFFHRKGNAIASENQRS